MPYHYEYPRACVTVDIIVFRNPEAPEVLLIRRLHPPFEGCWALPGGFMDMNETLEDAAARELEEETGLREIALQQLHTFSAIDRDPRHRTVSVTFFGFLNNKEQLVKAGSDAKETGWFPVKNLPVLAFDHREMIEMAESIRQKSTQSL